MTDKIGASILSSEIKKHIIMVIEIGRRRRWFISKNRRNHSLSQKQKMQMSRKSRPFLNFEISVLRHVYKAEFFFFTSFLSPFHLSASCPLNFLPSFLIFILHAHRERRENRVSSENIFQMCISADEEKNIQVYIIVVKKLLTSTLRRR